MKAGARALGIAESYRGTDESNTSTLAGCVVRADRILDGVAFGSCTVGGTDATDGAVELYDRLGREDVAYLLLSGVAPAWYNVVDLRRLHDATRCPVLSVTFEESDGLEPALREAFSGSELDVRLDVYRALPPRREVLLNGETRFLRSVGCSDEAAIDALRRVTPEGGRPEPLRLARLAARAADRFVRTGMG